MVDVLKYDDYRQFLKDFFEKKKESDSKYSLTYFSKLINSSDSYIKQVLAERRSLNLEKARLLAEKIRLKPLEASYFFTLVVKEGSDSENLQDYFESILRNFREMDGFDYNQEEVGKSIFKNSLSWEIYTYLGIPNVDQSVDSIIDCLSNKKATKEEITSTLKYLLESKAFKIIDGRYKTQNVVIEHSDEIRKVYALAMERAVEYLYGSTKSDTEYFDSFCIATGKQEFDQIQKLLEETKSKMAAIVNKSEKKDRICYYNSSLFLASKDLLDEE